MQGATYADGTAYWNGAAQSTDLAFGVFQPPAYIPSGQFYVAVLPAIDHEKIVDIAGMTITHEQPADTLARYALSFDNGATWQMWDGDSWESADLNSPSASDWSFRAQLLNVPDASWPVPTGDVLLAVGLYSSGTAAVLQISAIGLEVVGQVEDMDLFMEPVDATDAPATARVFAVLRDEDALALNTDLKAWVSRNGGTDWDQVTLAKVGDFLTDSYTVEGELTGFTHSDGGTDQAVFRLTSHNNKDFELRFLSQGIGV